MDEKAVEVADREFHERVREALSRREIVLRAQKSSALECWRVYGFSRLSSTMDLAEQLARGGRDSCAEEGLVEGSGALSGGQAVVIALSQARGRGRQERRWHSSPGEGLYLTFLLYPDKAPEGLIGISLMVGLAVQRTLGRFDVEGKLKWPNDLLSAARIDGFHRKLAGVLIETSSLSGKVCSLRLGIGINLNQADFPKEVPGVSARQLRGREIDYFDVLADLVREVSEMSEQYFSDGFTVFRDEWYERSLMEGAEVRLAGQSQVYTVVGVAADGGLIVTCDREDQRKETVVYSGEVLLANVAGN